MTLPENENWLHQIVTRIRCSLDLTEILAAAVEEVRSFLDLDRVKIYRFDGDWHGEVIAESLPKFKPQLPSLLGLHFPSGDIPTRDRDRFIKSRQRVVVNVGTQVRTTDYIDDDRTGQTLAQSDIRYAALDPCHAEYLQNMGVESSLVLPILHNGQLWGLLACHHSQPRHFQEAELQMVQLVVDQLSIAIAQSHLLSVARQQARSEAAINQISTLLHSPLPVAQMRQTVLEKLVQALHCDGGRLYITPEPTGAPAQLHTTGTQPHSLDLEKTPLWQSLLETTTPEDAERIENTPQQQIIPYIYTLNDLYLDPKLKEITWAFTETAIRSLLLIPLRYQHQCVGIVTLFRHAIDTETLWAGQKESDRRHYRPRRSFTRWRELQRDCTQPWTIEEQKLAQGLGIHLYLSIVQRRVENTIRHQASHDALTGLPNRLLFSQQLEIALVKGLQQGKMLAVVFLDLDGFKHINDTLGHATGDRLLQKVARRLSKLLRDRDVVARWGSDEFTILTEIADASHAQQVAQKVLNSLEKPLTLKNQKFYIKASLGIAIAPLDGKTTETLLKNADAAMHSAKQLGRNHYQLYTPAIGSESHNRLLIENNLYRALEQQEFVLHYQPQIERQTGKIVGAEALIRWQHPNGKLMSPFDFIPIAEETGLILPIGEWVLETACAQAIAWQNQGLPPIQIGVNFTAHQFLEPNLVETIVKILDKTGLDPRWLDVEITEGTAMQDVEFTITVLKTLQKLGIQVSLDDFGTGYSSLWTLKRFPLNTIKIDKSFIDDIASNSSQVDLAILKAVIEMAHGLNLKTVAEGIETQTQRDLLQSLKCDRFQGYLFSKPVPAAVLETQLTRTLDAIGQ